MWQFIQEWFSSYSKVQFRFFVLIIIQLHSAFKVKLIMVVRWIGKPENINYLQRVEKLCHLWIAFQLLQCSNMSITPPTDKKLNEKCVKNKTLYFAPQMAVNIEIPTA